ncbi:MAG: hypothetical protein ACRDT8_00160 [Micromonosporaceae bacterium]
MSCCTDTWGGTKTAHCAGCCVTFTALTAFDAHRRDWACRRPEDSGLADSGRRTQSGAVIWGWPDTRDAPFPRDSEAGTAERPLPGTPGTPRPSQAVTDSPDRRTDRAA